MFNHVTTIIFDLDGTIINSEPVHQKIEQTMMKDRSVMLGVHDYHEFIGMSGYDMWRILKDRYQLKDSVDELRAEKRLRLKQFLNQLNTSLLVPGVLDCIEKLHINQFTLALATSSGRSYADSILDGLKLRRYFKTVVTGWDVNQSKPAPDIFLLTLQNLEVSREECLVIEDSENGVKAAKSAGIRVIGYRNPHSINQDLKYADWVIDRFTDFPYDSLVKAGLFNGLKKYD